MIIKKIKFIMIVKLVLKPKTKEHNNFRSKYLSQKSFHFQLINYHK